MVILSFSSLSGDAPLPGQTAPSLVGRWATTALLYLVVLAAVAPLGSDAVMKCGTKTPSREHQLLDQARMLGLKKRHGRVGRKLLGETCDELPAICDQCVNIPVYVHLLAIPDPDSEYVIPHPTDADGFLAEETTTLEMMLSMVQDNIDMTNEVFQGTPFQFTFMADNYTLTINADWDSDPFNYTLEMSQELGVGGFESLNLYLSSTLTVGDIDAFGLARFPSNQEPDDGVWMRYDTVTGGGYPDNDLGYTLVHEIGHWLGLYHTFENSLAAIDGDPCSDSNTNDFVDDTGVHAGPSLESYNCTDFLFPDEQVEVPDTCPGQELRDPFFNIMNYLENEVCFEATESKFTCGQVERMWLQWNLYREFSSTCDEDEMEVLILIQYDYCEFPPQNSFYLSTVGSSEPIFDSETDFDTTANVYLNSVLVDLCVPRGEEYEYVVRDSVGNGTTVSPAIIQVDGAFGCELPTDFGSEAKVLFNSSSMDCNGTPVRNPNEPVDPQPSEPTSVPASEPTSMPASEPTSMPASTPATSKPTLKPTLKPTSMPTLKPASMPPTLDDGGDKLDANWFLFGNGEASGNGKGKSRKRH